MVDLSWFAIKDWFFKHGKWDIMKDVRGISWGKMRR
jgi:hypothetical protein